MADFRRRTLRARHKMRDDEDDSAQKQECAEDGQAEDYLHRS